MNEYDSVSQLYDPENPHSWSCCEYIILFFAWLIVVIIPIFWFYLFRNVRDYERAIIFRLGKIAGGARGPGVFLINPLTDSIRVIDLRMVTCDLPPQAMMTKDAVTVTVDAISFMKVTDPIKAIREVDDYANAFNNFAATTLRSVIGTYDLQKLLSDRDEINSKAQEIIEQETSSWGVAVPAVEIKDVKLPQNMQRAMAAEAEAERERRAKVVSSKGEAGRPNSWLRRRTRSATVPVRCSCGTCTRSSRFRRRRTARSCSRCPWRSCAGCRRSASRLSTTRSCAAERMLRFRGSASWRTRTNKLGVATHHMLAWPCHLCDG